MSQLAPAPAPATKLGIYRVLSARAGVHVSPLCLGAMSIGDKWGSFMGSMDKESSFKLLDAYFDKGDETSEEFIGEWAEKRGIRDQLFIATKYTTLFKRHDPKIIQKVNYSGNNTKSMHLSVRASMQKLRTDYIDLFYVHWWDYDTSIEETMDSLHNLVVQGKVLYLVGGISLLDCAIRLILTSRNAQGVSDTPAWVVAQANQYAKQSGKTPFTVYQGEWNVLKRSFERDVIPMARSFGMAICPWGVLGGGRLRTDAEEEQRKQSGEGGRTMMSSEWLRNPDEVAMSRALEKVAKEVGAKSINSIAIAYVMQKTTYVFPIIGGRKVEHLEQNLEALDLTLTPEQIQFLESQIPFDIGFPMNTFGTGNELEGTFAQRMAGSYQRIAPAQPLGAPVLEMQK
ncbi:putative aryl-alcohol dehydrogenase aad14 [Marasmius tenuissimus]|uniref:Aryl-alcohol dehydrogenase aad14 n=1 Tax=Marasmius tenuissimus TaxID=585030 RepID=A0ABR2ZMD5_9AGAR